MRSNLLSKLLTAIMASWFTLPAGANAGSLTYMHDSSALPGAQGPALTLHSITGSNEGANFTFILTFFNSTISGPSSAADDAVSGFINFDTDNNPNTGVSGLSLDIQGYEPDFGKFSPAKGGIDAYLNLGSEGDGFHGAAGLVDFVPTSTLLPSTTVPIAYADQVPGTTLSTLTITIPISLFSMNGLTVPDPGDFSVIVGNGNNATDFLPNLASVPEPPSLLLLSVCISLPLALSFRGRWRSRLCRASSPKK